jgi:hypothetical protein
MPKIRAGGITIDWDSHGSGEPPVVIRPGAAGCNQSPCVWALICCDEGVGA